MSKRSFDLEDRTLEFTKNIIRLCKKLSKDIINIEIIRQLIRSSGSVGANYREANDALSDKDFKHRMKICRKEAKETYYWLQLILEANNGFKGEVLKNIDEILQLKKIFSSIIDKTN